MVRRKHWTAMTPAALDALLAGRQAHWWDGFYADRQRPVPFFSHAPDESLAAWVSDGALAPGKAIDLGCGNGRNALYLAQHGFDAEGVDLAPSAIAWAQDQARRSAWPARFRCASLFDPLWPPACFDLACDSGCFHHMPPHRRSDYIARVAELLRDGGWLAMTCFKPEGGSGLTDDQVYERGDLGGGLGYSEDQLRALWSGRFEIHALRTMQALPDGADRFGKDFLWAMLARKI